MLASVRRRASSHLALLVIVGSFVGWSTWYLLLGPKGPYGDLSNGTYTDHFSHMNTARLFTHVGSDIWAKPLRDSVTALTPAQKAVLPEDLKRSSGQLYPVFTVPGWPADKPFVSSWSAYPDFHPPGAMVLTAPVAILYSFTDLSFSAANRLLILCFLAFSHISLFILFRSGLTIHRFRLVGFLVLFLVYLEVVHWSLEGFYEPLVIAPLVMCGRFLQQRRGLAAAVAFSLAAILHFRAYFFGPLVIYAAYLVIRERQWRSWKRPDFFAAAIAVILGLTSIGVFVTVWPWLLTVPAHNHVALTGAHVNLRAVATLLVVATVLGLAFAYARSWLDLALLLWLTVAGLVIQDTWAWDVLSIFAWLGLPVACSRARLVLAQTTRIAAVFFLGIYVFQNHTLLDPTWLQKVL